MTKAAPISLSEMTHEYAERETSALLALARVGVPVGRIVVVPAAAEEQFYRLNNLSGRLEQVFARVDPADPDDDDLADLAPTALELLAGHFLLDEFIDRFYESLAGLPRTLLVRRAQEDGELAEGARGALLAVKRRWANEWQDDVIWRRLREGGPLLPPPKELLVHAGPLFPLQPPLLTKARAALGLEASFLADPSGALCRIAFG